MTMRATTFLIVTVSLAGCAIGPSTKVTPPAPRSLTGGDSVITPGGRAFLDSLTAARDTVLVP